jgi:peptidoglycan/xylan/chitin deacetylase (PgdA/CDA1 family)
MVSVRHLVKNAVLDRVPRLLRKGPTSTNRVALTFDDGPDEMTEQYLDLLDELGVPATFFVVGKRAASLPELTRDYVRRGHQLAGHGYDHARFTSLDRRALLEQCESTDRAIYGQVSGRPWVRPPHGAIDPRSVFALVTAGYTVAMWSFDSYDYTTKDPAALVKHCAPGEIVAGDVVLFHEGQTWTLEALPIIVQALQAAGLECVTMHDLFAS